MRKTVIIESISLILVLLFTYTAVSKILEHDLFAIVLSEAPAIGKYATLISWLLPAAEILVVILLLVPSLRLTGLFASLFLLLVFTMYLLWMVVFRINLPCNCGGVLKALSWKQHIFFNLFFIVLSACCIILYPGHKIHLQKTPP